MEFRFNINEVFRQPIVEIGHTLIPQGFKGDRRALWDTLSKVTDVVNAMGSASATAQGLSKPITTAERLRNSEQQVVYLLMDHSAFNGKGAVTGMLKTGKKGLYVFDREGHHYQVQAPCILDFYVHESRQRSGLGKMLFEHMLQKDEVEPEKLAIDRPSDKFLGFLNKHYKLDDPIRQMNNYVVYDGFFPGAKEKNGGGDRPQAINNNGDTPSKRGSNGLQTQTVTSPYGRYGAPRPPCSMGQIIHNQTTAVSAQEPMGQNVQDQQRLDLQQTGKQEGCVVGVNDTVSAPDLATRNSNLPAAGFGSGTCEDPRTRRIPNEVPSSDSAKYYWPFNVPNEGYLQVPRQRQINTYDSSMQDILQPDCVVEKAVGPKKVPLDPYGRPHQQKQHKVLVPVHSNHSHVGGNKGKMYSITNPNKTNVLVDDETPAKLKFNHFNQPVVKNERVERTRFINLPADQNYINIQQGNVQNYENMIHLNDVQYYGHYGNIGEAQNTCNSQQVNQNIKINEFDAQQNNGTNVHYDQRINQQNYVGAQQIKPEANEIIYNQKQDVFQPGAQQTNQNIPQQHNHLIQGNVQEVPQMNYSHEQNLNNRQNQNMLVQGASQIVNTPQLNYQTVGASGDITQETGYQNPQNHHGYQAYQPNVYQNHQIVDQQNAQQVYQPPNVHQNTYKSPQNFVQQGPHSPQQDIYLNHQMAQNPQNAPQDHQSLQRHTQPNVYQNQQNVQLQQIAQQGNQQLQQQNQQNAHLQQVAQQSQQQLQQNDYQPAQNVQDQHNFKSPHGNVPQNIHQNVQHITQTIPQTQVDVTQQQGITSPVVHSSAVHQNLQGNVTQTNHQSTQQIQDARNQQVLNPLHHSPQTNIVPHQQNYFNQHQPNLTNLNQQANNQGQGISQHNVQPNLMQHKNNNMQENLLPAIYGNGRDQTSVPVSQNQERSGLVTNCQPSGLFPINQQLSQKQMADLTAQNKVPIVNVNTQNQSGVCQNFSNTQDNQANFGAMPVQNVNSELQGIQPQHNMGNTDQVSSPVLKEQQVVASSQNHIAEQAGNQSYNPTSHQQLKAPNNGLPDAKSINEFRNNTYGQNFKPSYTTTNQHYGQNARTGFKQQATRPVNQFESQLNSALTPRSFSDQKIVEVKSDGLHKKTNHEMYTNGKSRSAANVGGQNRHQQEIVGDKSQKVNNSEKSDGLQEMNVINRNQLVTNVGGQNQLNTNINQGVKQFNTGYAVDDQNGKQYGNQQRLIGGSTPNNQGVIDSNTHQQTISYDGNNQQNLAISGNSSGNQHTSGVNMNVPQDLSRYPSVHQPPQVTTNLLQNSQNTSGLYQNGNIMYRDNQQAQNVVQNNQAPQSDQVYQRVNQAHGFDQKMQQNIHNNQQSTTQYYTQGDFIPPQINQQNLTRPFTTETPDGRTNLQQNPSGYQNGIGIVQQNSVPQNLNNYEGRNMINAQQQNMSQSVNFVEQNLNPGPSYAVHHPNPAVVQNPNERSMPNEVQQNGQNAMQHNYQHQQYVNENCVQNVTNAGQQNMNISGLQNNYQLQPAAHIHAQGDFVPSQSNQLGNVDIKSGMNNVHQSTINPHNNQFNSGNNPSPPVYQQNLPNVCNTAQQNFDQSNTQQLNQQNYNQQTMNHHNMSDATQQNLNTGVPQNEIRYDNQQVLNHNQQYTSNSGEQGSNVAYQNVNNSEQQISEQSNQHYSGVTTEQNIDNKLANSVQHQNQHNVSDVGKNGQPLNGLQATTSELLRENPYKIVEPLIPAEHTVRPPLPQRQSKTPTSNVRQLVSSTRAPSRLQSDVKSQNPLPLAASPTKKPLQSVNSLQRNMVLALSKVNLSKNQPADRQSQIYCGAQSNITQRKTCGSGSTKGISGGSPQAAAADRASADLQEATPPPKLDRPQTLFLQTTDGDGGDDAHNDNANSSADELDNIENDFVSKVEVSTVAAPNKQPPPGGDEETTGARKTPSHLTEQGYFDLKFYHNKLW